MQNLLKVIASVGPVFIKSGDKFVWAPFVDGDVSYHGILAGADDVIVGDDSDQTQWYARLDLDNIPSVDHVTNLISSVLGAPSRVHPNGARNWNVNGVLVIYLKGGIEFIEHYDDLIKGKEDARKDMSIIINAADDALADASLFIEPLGDDVEKAFTDLTDALERFRAAVENA